VRFDEWMNKVDLLSRSWFGLSIYDLPDMSFRDAYDSGITPDAFMEESLPDLEALGSLILS